MSVCRWRYLAPVPALASLALCASPAPAAVTAYRVAMVRLVFQLAGPALAHAGPILSSLPGLAPQAMPEGRWATTLPAVEAAYIQQKLANTPDVNYVSPVGEVHESSLPAGLVPDDPCYSSQCGPVHPIEVEDPAEGAGTTVVHPDGQTDLWAINAGEAWQITKGSPNILVAVLDTGVDTNQPELAGKVIVGPDECAGDRADCGLDIDENGHGTFVAGLIAAATNDGTGIAGLGWATRVLSIKVLGYSGNGNTLDEANGIYAAVTAGARVINISSSNEPCGPGVAPADCGPNLDQERAIEYAIAHGVVVVAAAGNNLSDQPVYPADYPGVLSVAASTDTGVVNPQNGGSYLDFSNYGRDANIAAPGIDVLSTWYDGNYAVESGTSYAAPHVAAAAALVLAVDPRLSGAQVSTLLQQTAPPLLPGGQRIDGGFLDVGAAVQAAAERQVPDHLDGYLLAGVHGQTAVTGGIGQEGPLTRHISGNIVAAAVVANGLGYWLASSAGGVYAFGSASFLGSAAGRHLAKPVVAMAALSNGRGYWLVTASGQVLAFGKARLYGSPARFHLAKPVVGIAATPNGRGYWLVTASGQVLAFGKARRYGSPARLHLAKPVVGIATAPGGRGYWLVGSDGGVFNYGDAGWYGSVAGTSPRQAVIGIVPSPDGQGYWLAGRHGGVWAFGSAPHELGPMPEPAWPVAAIAS